MRHGHRHWPGHRAEGHATDIYHDIVCRHQVEIEIWPPRAEINFLDDWTANPIDTQVRFEATVYNSDQGYLWDVRDINGNPGTGSIDASGLYRAPPKGTLQSGVTEIVVATAQEDRLRKAYAWVTLVGVGPQPVTPPSVAIWPQQIDLYYWQGGNNNYMDDSNKACQFSATVYDSTATVEWLVNNVLQGSTGPWFFYQAPTSGGDTIVTMRAQLQGNTSVFDEAKIILRNYNWPGA